MASILPILVSLCGIYLFVKLRGFVLLHPIRVIRGSRALISDGAGFRATALAMAGTLGVGNILGVCVGIGVGGAGALFWLWISSLLSAVIKYCEVTLLKDLQLRGVDCKRGFASCIKVYLGAGSGVISAVYSAVVVALSLVMGSALQGLAVVESAGSVFNTPPWLIGVLTSMLVLFGIFGGADRIERITAVVIPMATIVYIILTLSVIAVNFRRLPSVLSTIASDAFELRAGVGGLIAFITSAPLREGFCRGILSNEAGAGTSSLAHSRSAFADPCTAGIMGILEVFFDTSLLCTLTGLAVLTGGDGSSSGLGLIIGAVGSSLSPALIPVLMLLVFAFAYSTVICWFYYGEASLGGASSLCRRSFSVVFFGFLTFGYGIGRSRLIFITDCLMLFASVPVLYTLIKGSDRVLALSESVGLVGRVKLFGRNRIKGNGSLRGSDGQAGPSSRQIPPRSARE